MVFKVEVTIGMAINTLPQPYKDQFINNLIKLGCRNDYFQERMRNSIHEFVDFSLTWSNTPEGHDYWREFHFRLKSGEMEDLYRHLLKKTLIPY